MVSQPDSLKPAEILNRLDECLRALDLLDARLPAIYVATAIERIREQFDIPDNPSSSD